MMFDLYSELGRSLLDLERNAELLDDLLLPSTSAKSSEGKPPVSAGPQAPVSVSLLDLKLDVEKLLGQWCSLVVAEQSNDLPSFGSSVAHRARWLRERLEIVATAPWGRQCAEQVIAKAQLVSLAVSPPVTDTDPQPPEWVTTREAVQWLQAWYSIRVSRWRVRNWVESGALEVRLNPNGVKQVRLLSVRALATQSDYRSAHP